MMKKYLDKLPIEIKVLLDAARVVSKKNNVGVWLVGGVVRDFILGVSNLDLDIVVEGDGVKFSQELARVLKTRVTIHHRFGTATIFLMGGYKVDIATARKEVYPYPASLPVVTPGIIRDDLLRRDFTINAMAQGLGAGSSGELLDLFGGRKDILNKKIRILHNLSFIDDPTRILRAIRFEQRYNFRLEPVTLLALKDAAAKGMLKKVGPQRIRDELILLLNESEPLSQIRRIQELAGLTFINPRLKLSFESYSLMRVIAREIEWFKNEYAHVRKLDAWLIYFMAILDSLGIIQVKAVLKKFALRKGDGKRVLSYKRVNRSFIAKLSKQGIKPSQVFSLLDPLSYETILMIKAKFRNKNLQKNIVDFFAVYNRMRVLVSGNDLRAMGIKSGPCYRKILGKILIAKLNGLVKTKDDELSLINKIKGRPMVQSAAGSRPNRKGVPIKKGHP